MIQCLFDESEIENDFINLVKQNYSQGMFERSAEIMLGNDWQEISTEIIEEFAPQLKGSLERYVIGSQKRR